MTLEELISNLLELARQTEHHPDEECKMAASVIYSLLSALSMPAEVRAMELRLLMRATADYSRGFIRRATASQN